MKKKIYLLILPMLCLMANVSWTQCGDLYIEGVIDGPLGGGTPKGFHFCASAAIPDLSIYGIGVANNGGGSDGQEYTFPADALASGDCIWVASESPNFTTWFGFSPCYVDGIANVNGDDAVELFCSGSVVDVYGDVIPDGTGEPWEYLDSWANANDAVQNPTYVVGEWTYGGPNALDGETDNATATTPYPDLSINCPVGLPDISIDDVSMVEGNTGTLTYTFTVSIDIMDASDVTVDYTTTDGTATTADMDYVAASGTATITAGTTSTTLDVTVNSDTNLESTEIFTVDLSNPSANANLADNQGEGEIIDDDTAPVTCPMAGDIIITEIMQNPSAVGDAAGEYFEIYNTTATAIDIDGWAIQDDGSDDHTINNGGPLMVPANGYLVLGINSDMSANGGLTVDYQYSSYSLSNSADEVVLVCDPLVAMTEIDRVDYDGGATFPDPTGASMNLDIAAFDGTSNDMGSNWCESTISYGLGDLGTPNAANESCGSACPPTLNLTGTNAGDDTDANNMADNESSGTITSDQMILATAVIDYDSATDIELMPGFETIIGSVFEAFIDGCNGGAGGSN